MQAYSRIWQYWYYHSPGMMLYSLWSSSHQRVFQNVARPCILLLIGNVYTLRSICVGHTMYRTLSWTRKRMFRRLMSPLSSTCGQEQYMYRRIWSLPVSGSLMSIWIFLISTAFTWLIVTCIATVPRAIWPESHAESAEVLCKRLVRKNAGREDTSLPVQHRIDVVGSSVLTQPCYFSCCI